MRCFHGVQFQRKKGRDWQSWSFFPFFSLIFRIFFNFYLLISIFKQTTCTRTVFLKNQQCPSLPPRFEAGESPSHFHQSLQRRNEGSSSFFFLPFFFLILIRSEEHTS